VTRPSDSSWFGFELGGLRDEGSEPRRNGAVEGELLASLCDRESEAVSSDRGMEGKGFVLKR